MSQCHRLRSFFKDIEPDARCANCDRPVGEHEDKPCPVGRGLGDQFVGYCPMCGQHASDHRKLIEKMMVEYAQVLRAAWLNPSDGPLQQAVHTFEREHTTQLEPFWDNWV